MEALEYDTFRELYEILKPMVKTERSPEERDVDSIEGERERVTKQLELTMSAVDCIGHAWPKAVNTQAEYHHQVCLLLSNELPSNNWKVQLSILTTLKALFERLVVITIQ